MRLHLLVKSETTPVMSHPQHELNKSNSRDAKGDGKSL